MGLLSQNSCVSDHRIHSDTVCTWTIALAGWLKGNQLQWGRGILLMGGEPIKLTELRVLCMERNWQGVLASGVTLNQWGGACAHFIPLTSPAGVWSDITALKEDSFSAGERKIQQLWCSCEFYTSLLHSLCFISVSCPSVWFKIIYESLISWK